MTDTIYVATERPIQLVGGNHCVALFPPTKSRKETLLLLQDGRISSLKGARIQGVGPARFAESQGFVPASAGDPRAAKLQAVHNAREGLKLIEDKLQKRAIEVQLARAMQPGWYVPFSPEKRGGPVQVSAATDFTTHIFDLAAGITTAQVAIEYTPESVEIAGFGVNLSQGWLVGTAEEAVTQPRLTPYGGLIEHAAFVLCNAGVVTLVSRNLEEPTGDETDPDFMRGRMVLQLVDSEDQLVLGVSAGDELVVQYHRNGEVLYREEGIQGQRLTMGAFVSAMGAALVAVAAKDAASTKKPRARKVS